VPLGEEVEKMFRAITTGLVLGSFVLMFNSLGFADPTITNGSFEAVQISGEFSSNPADIPGWTHTGDPGDSLLWRAGPQCCGGTDMALAGDGNQFVTLGGGFDAPGSAAWSQTISGLTIGQSYDINFLMASEGETATQQITAGITSGSLTPSETFTSLPTSSLFWLNWGPEEYTFMATATSATLQFSVTNQQYDVGLDAVSITTATTTVPEPSGLTFLVSGLLGLAGTVRRLFRS
jgi:Protein of unknown function (DUF642)